MYSTPTVISAVGLLWQRSRIAVTEYRSERRLCDRLGTHMSIPAFRIRSLPDVSTFHSRIFNVPDLTSRSASVSTSIKLSQNEQRIRETFVYAIRMSHTDQSAAKPNQSGGSAAAIV